MPMRISDRLQGRQGSAKSADGPIREVAVRLRKQVIDRIDHNALAQLDETAKKEHLKGELETLINADPNHLSGSERRAVVQTVLDEILGLGPLETLLSDPTVSDILVNGPKTIYVERHGKLQQVEAAFRDNSHLVNTISRIAAQVGRRVDESSPIVDARLADGSRVNAIIPPLALDGAALSIRRFGAKALSIDDLVGFGAMNEDMRNYLRAAVISKCNVLVSGYRGWKTTLLNALSNYIPEGACHHSRGLRGTSVATGTHGSPGESTPKYGRAG